MDARATSGEGGIITVTASEALNILGQLSQITAARKRGRGSGTRGASIELNTIQFTLTGGDLVDAQNNRTFLGGTVTIQGPEGSGTEAESIMITGQDGFGNPSKISTATNSQGPGGNIMLHAQQIAVGNGASITASSASQEMRAGSGGDIVLASSGFIFIDEATITSAAQEGTGGNVTFTAQGGIVLANTATVTTKAEGLGNAGDIHFKTAGSIKFADSLVSTLATRADGGNIKLTAVNTIRMINSMLTSSVSGGETTWAATSASIRNSSFCKTAGFWRTPSKGRAGTFP
ncbi:MAG: hypothetical protein D6690_07220 [Nitrospirae bacterium]|nr:MAG: hypothetical protein D6690_07220 [Nitrospirota bacterium]